MKRRILSFLLALCMVLTLSPITVYAAPDSAEKSDLVGMQARAEQTNPLYDEDRQKTPSLYDPPKLFSTLNSAESADLRSGNDNSLLTLINGLEQRQPTISVLWKISASEISTNDDLEALLLAVFAVAMSHTGAPTQGDYLLWQYAGMSCHAEVFDERSGNYFLRLTYNVQYYTTAEQEAAVTAKLDEVMASFGFTEETGDYDKIKTIYDYICANVTYDYANLNDDNYTLKHTAYAALIDGTAVCQGYALLLYRMLLSAGIDNRIISGTANGGGHGWNIVALNNFYYNADSTWDAGQTEYSYFLKCPDNFTDHVRDAEFDTAEFHAYYPMGAADYVPGGSSIHASGTCGEDVNWVLGSDGILTVSGTGSMDDYEKAEDAPWYDYRDYVLGVVVEEGVQHVGNYAFAKYPRLCAVSVASGSVGKLAFYNCDALLAVDLLEGVENVGQQAFNHCDILAAVSVPIGMKRFGGQAFEYCDALQAVLITDLAAWCDIEFAAINANPLSQFADLYLNEEKITDLVIPAGVTQIKPFAFTEGNFTSVTLPDGVKSIGESAFFRAKMAEVDLPLGLETIGKSAFSMCQSLSKIIVPEGVKTIGWEAFGNTGLKEIHLPSTLESIEDYTFYGVSGADLYITDLAAWCNVSLVNRMSHPNRGGGDLYLNGVKVTDLVIPSGVEEIKPFTFYNGTYTSVTIPSGVKTIGNSAFYESNVAKLTLPEGLLVLDSAAFARCQSLDAVTLPETLTTIGSNAFEYTRIKTLRIPASVTEIGQWAFAQNYYLTTIHFDGNAPSFGNNCFTGSTITAYYPAGNPTWTPDVLQNYGGNITWVALCMDHTAVPIPGKEPDCTQTGLTEGSKCSKCGEILVAQETIPANGHTEVNDIAVAPDCINPGLSAGSHCSVCGEILSGQQQLDPLGHSFTQYISNNDATAEADGTKTAVCDRDDCGEVSTITDEGSQMVSLEITTPPAKTEYLAGREELDVTGAIATVTRANGQTFTVEITNDMVTGFDNTAPGKQTLTVSCLGLSAPLSVVIRGAVVVFQMDDGTEISRAEYPFGAEVTIPADPVKPSDETYTYTFTGWDKPVTTADADAIYTATFVSSYIDYTIVFQYDDGTIIAQQTLHYGDEVTIPAEPEKPEGTEETDIFRGWDKAVSPTCTGSVTYTAVFGPEVLPGDFTGDDLVTDDDAIYLLWHTLFPERYPLQGNGDLTGDDLVTDDDAIYLLWHTLFPERYPLTTTIQKRGKEK